MVKTHDVITTVIMPGQMMKIPTLINALMLKWPNDPNAYYKAIGSIGGSSRSGYLQLRIISGEKYWAA